MNIQEREQLAAFLSQLVGARLTRKDGEAESLIAEAASRQPDATYLLVQKAFLQEQALKNAQNRIDQLQGEVDGLRAAAQPRGGFTDGNSWGSAAARPQPAMPSAAFPAMAPAMAPASGGWGSGWLGNVATTAAGVVAGSFLFQGIEHLMGHHDNNGGGLLGGNSLSATPNESTVINNYFESDNQAGSGLARDSLDEDDGGFSDGDSDSSWV